MIPPEDVAEILKPMTFELEDIDPACFLSILEPVVFELEDPIP